MESESRIQPTPEGDRPSDRTPKNRPCLVTLIALLLVIASVGIEVGNLFSFSPWTATQTRPDASTDAFPNSRVNPYGVNTFLSNEVEQWKREKTMEMIAASGVGWIKQQILWSDIEPQRGSHWDEKYQQDAWKKYDDIVNLAERYGVRIIARLDHTPAWARPPDSTAGTPPSDPNDYANFVGEFIQRYRGRVQYLQIWNEPNLSAEWGGQIDPDSYFRLLQAAYTRAKEVDPNVVILSAPMAMTNEHSERAMPEFDYWQRLYTLGAGEYFDIMTASAYGLDQPPTAPAARSVINVRRVELLRSMMEAHGDGEKAVWLNEYGWDAAPEDMPREQLIWQRVTDDQQADWTSEGIAWMRRNWPWLGVASIWYFRQNGDIPPDAPEYYFRMVDLEFTPRKVYLTIQKDATAQQLAQPGTYGEMEAPIVAFGPWERIGAEHATDGQYITSSTSGASIELRFFGSDVDLLLPKEPGHGLLYLEVDGRPAKGPAIQRDGSGKSAIDLDELNGLDRISIISGLGNSRPQAEHRLRMTLGSNTTFALDGVVIGYHRAYPQFLLVSMLGLLGIGGAVQLMRRRW